mmetsp:Transcript_19031/g.26014  ORF Transcript_19031/g.26014 Transcript_19031/m.26014 type:complete len:131 (-) Transcript_19031:62-454(-)
MADIDAFFASKSSHLTRPQYVFIATNEGSGYVQEILRQNGYYLLKDVIKPHIDDFQLTSLDEFILEAQFMLKAEVFLSYGISQINDVIEHERMLAGKSWCERDVIAMNDKTYIHKHDSWCHLFRNITSIV